MKTVIIVESPAKAKKIGGFFKDGTIVTSSFGHIIDYKIEKNEGKDSLLIDLKYNSGNPVINSIQRISKPGRRIFSSAESLPKVSNGLGIAIVSTPKGVMTDQDARKNQVGGEIICKVF